MKNAEDLPSGWSWERFELVNVAGLFVLVKGRRWGRGSGGIGIKARRGI